MFRIQPKPPYPSEADTGVSEISVRTSSSFLCSFSAFPITFNDSSFIRRRV